MKYINEERSFFSKMMMLSVGLVAIMLAGNVHATKLKQQNLTQLITSSESIISGVVKSVTDGFSEKGMPYTEITIGVGSVAKGALEEETDYTFRQFGLLKPKSNGKGKVYLGAMPEGFSRWQKGELIVAFLYKPASRTGLQTTAGMAQGKFNIVDGKLSNQFQNAGLFDGVEINSELISDEQQNMMTLTGPVDASAFMNLVGQAVKNNWIENGEMK